MVNAFIPSNSPPPAWLNEHCAKKWLLMERTAQASGSWRIGWKEDQFCRRHWKIGGGLIPPPKKQLNTNIYICVYIMCIYIYNVCVYIYIMYVYIYITCIYIYVYTYTCIYIYYPLQMLPSLSISQCISLFIQGWKMKMMFKSKAWTHLVLRLWCEHLLTSDRAESQLTGKMYGSRS